MIAAAEVALALLALGSVLTLAWLLLGSATALIGLAVSAFLSRLRHPRR